MTNIDLEQLDKYYRERQENFKNYLDAELEQFKDSNKEYLSAVIAEACEHAKNLFESQNKKAFERFEKAKEKVKELISKKSLPESVIKRIIESDKKSLGQSLQSNQSFFEKSIAYYKGLLNK